ncbi:hypothetical protein [Cellulosimicrobium composti]|uniref:hypothetical protein n=1 Tax=Cellulosimicrobium composti TaxID=2672572 RepID=UPI0037B1FFFC
MLAEPWLDRGVGQAAVRLPSPRRHALEQTGGRVEVLVDPLPERGDALPGLPRALVADARGLGDADAVDELGDWRAARSTLVASSP